MDMDTTANPNLVRILCIGDIVGRPGRKLLAKVLPGFRREQRIDFVVANGENAAAGSGLVPKVLEDILKAGADVVTSGDHIYKNRDVFPCLENTRLLRPLNYVPAAEGNGYGVYELGNDLRIAVVNLQGRVFMDPCECPFLAIDSLLAGIAQQAQLVVVDFHAEATSEKIAMGWHLDGRITALVGTHTHVATADARVLPAGTAYITDLGMTGAHEGVLGRVKETVLHRFTTQMPARFDVAEGDVRLCGALITANATTGRAEAIERVELSDNHNITQP